MPQSKAISFLGPEDSAVPAVSYSCESWQGILRPRPPTHWKRSFIAWQGSQKSTLGKCFGT